MVVAPRIAQDDHLECEEEFVLPELRDRLDDAEEPALMKRLITRVFSPVRVLVQETGPVNRSGP